MYKSMNHKIILEIFVCKVEKQLTTGNGENAVSVIT